MIILDEDIINQNAEQPFDVRKEISDLKNRVSALEEPEPSDGTSDESV